VSTCRPGPTSPPSGGHETQDGTPAVTQLHRGPHSWSIKRFVRIARRYRTIQIRAGQQILTAKDPLPPDLRDALALITRSGDAHSFDKSQGKPGQA
jgi:hypothetical protein